LYRGLFLLNAMLVMVILPCILSGSIVSEEQFRVSVKVGDWVKYYVLISGNVAEERAQKR